MADDREFLDELPTGIDLSAARRYELLVADVIANPHKWAKVNDDGVVSPQRATALCSAIRARKIKAFQTTDAASGEFEAERVKVGRDEPKGDDQYDVYVKFAPKVKGGG